MDEKSFLRWQSYASVLYDLKPRTARVLEFMDGHDRGTAEMLWEVMPEMIKVAKMLAKHLEGLLNFTLFPITNALAEGFNSKIQSLKADARSFRNALN
jgi:transposase